MAQKIGTKVQLKVLSSKFFVLFFAFFGVVVACYKKKLCGYK